MTNKNIVPLLEATRLARVLMDYLIWQGMFGNGLLIGILSLTMQARLPIIPQAHHQELNGLSVAEAGIVRLKMCEHQSDSIVYQHFLLEAKAFDVHQALHLESPVSLHLTV